MSIKDFLSLIVLINQKWTIILTVILLILALLYEYAIYNIGLITGDYYKIMNEKDVSQFWHQTLISIFLIVGMSSAKCAKVAVSQWLYVGWRHNLTHKLHLKYFINLAYFRLNTLRKNDENQHSKTDNIDQRITQDVEKMCDSLSTLIPEVLVSPFIIIFYAQNCFLVSGFLGPSACIIFFIISSVINRSLVKSIAKKVYHQERCEGDFRAQHFRVKNNAEAIAFLSGDTVEHHEAHALLNQLISVQKKIVIHNLFLTFSINLTDYLGSILSFIALAIPLFSGRYDNLKPADLSRLISQNAFYTMYLINCFTRLIDLSMTISKFLGTMNRILELNDELTINLQKSSKSWIHKRPLKDSLPFLICSNVKINTPLQEDRKEKCIIKKFSARLFLGENILITGSSGIGKTSLLRTIKHLWLQVEGTIDWRLGLEDPCQVMFITSIPVLSKRCLASQIIYPKVFHIKKYQNDIHFLSTIKNILHTLELDHLMEINLLEDQALSWSELLSYGESQRLNLARVFYHQPKVVFLDEATNGLSCEFEQKLIKMLQSLNITVIQSGHRLSTELFQRQLHLGDNREIVDILL